MSNTYQIASVTLYAIEIFFDNNRYSNHTHAISRSIFEYIMGAEQKNISVHEIFAKIFSVSNHSKISS